MRVFIIASIVGLAGQAAAADLWCMPDRICRGDACKPTRDEETSVRLQDFEAARPVLRAAAEDMPMLRVQEGATLGWRGADGAGATQTLTWRKADGAFAYQRRLDARVWTATGRCEVQ